MQLKKSFLFLALGGLIASPVYAEKEEREDVGKYTVQDEAKKDRDLPGTGLGNCKYWELN